MSWGDYKPYVRASDKKKIAEKKLAKLRKKNPNIQPITIQGKKLVSNWWGKAWNKNLECYADYDHRISRGRSYVRNSSILDLKITACTIDALVQGSETYKVAIEMEPLSKKNWLKIQSDCQGEFKSLQALLDGKFPKELGEILAKPKIGLFPSSSEISFRCNCLDWANMCKHVAAALYGVGVRLDSQPSLLFTLRDIKVDDLISKAITHKKLSFLEKAKKKSSRVIADSDLSQLFGIDVEEMSHTFLPSKAKQRKKLKMKPSKNCNKREVTSQNRKIKQTLNLKDSEKRVLELLSEKKHCSASDKVFAEEANVSRTYLRTILEQLVEKEYIKKEKNGRKVTFKYE